MYAIIKTGGKQYRVSEGDRLQVEKLVGGLIARGALRDGGRKGDLAEMVWAVIDFHFYRMIRDARLTPGQAKAKAKRQLAVLIRSHLAGAFSAGEGKTD